MDKEAALTEAAVAYLAAQGSTQTEIARTLNVSQSAVSRLLAKVEEEKAYLVKQPPYRFKDEAVGPELMREVLRRVSPKQIADDLDTLARKNGCLRGPVVRVFPINRSTEASQADRFRAFAAQAAPYVYSLINRDTVKICGVMWGYMLHDLAGELRKLQADWKRTEVRVVPLSGDPVQQSQEPPSLTSSNIAAELGRIVNGETYRAPWLGVVPALIPEVFKGRDRKAIERFIKMVPDYEAIFGKDVDDERALANHLDALLSSVGTNARPLGFGSGRLLASLGRRVESLKSDIYGDLGGVLLPRDVSQPTDLVRTIETCWTGIKRSHMERCAKRGATDDVHSGRPGTIILSLGADRAPVIAAAVSQGLVNHLIIDQELEQALLKLVPSLGGRASKG